MNILNLAGGGYKASINADRGGNCISLTNEKYKARILREPDYSDITQNPYLYGMPILFPVNRISEGSFEFEGRTYSFPINEPNTGCSLHGALHAMPFEVTEHSPSSAALIYQATETEPYLSFPHSFVIEMRYVLSENGLEHTVTLENRSENNMPYFLGFHTTFCLPFSQLSEQSDLRAYADVSREFERNMNNYLPTGKCPKADTVTKALKNGDFIPLREPISRHYQAGNSGIMSITDIKTGLSLMYESCADYGYRLIYNGDASSYICMEPQTCIANCQNSPFPRETVGFAYLRPKEKKSFYSKIYLKERDKK